ncbi:DNA replication/repair protein RecF [Aquisalimonas asiatica]|uniref:DNA replication and repair protein RecF n=1 Tax=Aquisalimonas asiatica TaxID=406100 RepID=A0A1H8UCG5_9GAMM|nr:DNA replication/repair protein RecF [Aquisalimonas asiatica]SEP00573.1 DNA replication and repair protein RecF [Aquisalimonas asiatica]
MAIASLTVSGVRNLADATLECDPRCNVIAGANAAGKTSVLEAIHVLARARSFRTARLDQVRRDGTAELLVRGDVQVGTGAHRLGVARGESGTRVRIDGADARGLSELARWLPVQVINTESQRLLQDGPSARRSYLNWSAFHVEHGYHEAWRRYDRALRQRNAALREGDSRTARALEGELVSAAGAVDTLRSGVLAELQPHLDVYLQRWLPETPVQIVYRRGWSQSRTLADTLADQHESELNMGYTLSGPHRADLQLRVHGMDAQHRLSRGQQKVLVVAMLLAQASVIATQGGVQPVLLVDDLPAELDVEYRAAVLQAIEESQGQVFFTAIETEALAVSAGRLFHVEQGTLQEMI